MLPPIEERYWNDVVNHSDSMEFDWIGMDQAGYLGMFSSYNTGYTPKKFFSSYEKYRELILLLDSLPAITESVLVTTEKGTFSEWLADSQKGLYGFDYYDAHRVHKLNQYDLISKPIQPLHSSLIESIYSFSNVIPLFNLSFDGNVSFSDLKSSERGFFEPL